MDGGTAAAHRGGRPSGCPSTGTSGWKHDADAAAPLLGGPDPCPAVDQHGGGPPPPPPTPDDPPPLLIKLGGSALTDKAVRGAARPAAAAAAATVLAAAWRAHPHLVLIHGAGSCGHHEAKEAGVHVGHGGAAGVAATHAAVARLSAVVVDAAVAAGLPAVALPPLAVGGGGGGGSSTPRVVLLSSTAGVYTHPPDHPAARLVRRLPIGGPSAGWAGATAPSPGDLVTTTAAHDVTGGMAAKVAATDAMVRRGAGALRVLLSSIDALGGRGGALGDLASTLGRAGVDGWGGGGGGTTPSAWTARGPCGRVRPPPPTGGSAMATAEGGGGAGCGPLKGRARGAARAARCGGTARRGGACAGAAAAVGRGGPCESECVACARPFRPHPPRATRASTITNASQKSVT
ncbi:hypothetical protein BU14_0196s0022 [Porphyra umbilicalis]|uniref:Aspartate/glutamate/uridylate kinase domain-containing protein n=1 Tax=Porphyra umbilicalis TaxID=2786 RepID=A0A1X6P6H5_PORUM|nr:hypothetical protein BU14_0196s0022 [Porphyra umbilicalis]|eukprot:OSX76355.1 hypothetical protein BU14_0196s0022 [Porphyra umbilicalis]